MLWYDIANAIHYLGLVALFGSFVIHPRAGARLRAATDAVECRRWLEWLELIRGMFHGGMAMLLVTGLAMTAMRWREPPAFVAVGMVALIGSWILFGAIVARHTRTIRTLLVDDVQELSPEQAQAIRRPLPWMVMFAINLATIGVLFVMTLKPGWPGAIALVAGAAALGAVMSSLALRRERTAAPHQAGLDVRPVVR